MNDDYYSVLVCVRKDRSDVYINGLPVCESTSSTPTMAKTTKRKDEESISKELESAITALCFAQNLFSKPS